MRESITLDQARSAFLDDVKLRHAPLTHRSYKSQLRRLTDWPLTPAACQKVIVEALGDGMARSSVRLIAIVLKAFSTWLVEQGYYAESPMKGVRYPKPDTDKPHRVLSSDERTRIEAAIQTSEERNLVALLSVGLRAAEVLSVRMEDIDADGLILVRGKGSRWRYVPCPDLVLPDSGPVVPLSYKQLRARVRALARRAKVAGITAHTFRHSWATESIQQHDLGTVQAVGGWAGPDMLEWYSRSYYRKAAALRMRG